MKELATALMLVVIGSSASAADRLKGQDAYKVCAACHNGKPDALGPDLKGIVGRQAGALPGYRFSGPLKRSAILWTTDNLKTFIINPQTLIPGNRMPFAGVEDDVAADIVAYLATAH